MSSKRVLLMDDEAGILDIMSIFLKKNNIDHMCTSTGSEALKVFKEEYDKGQGFEVVIMDVIVPGDLGAKELVAPLKAIDSSVKLIVSSGDSVAGAMNNPEKFGFYSSLRKPFKSADLISLIKRALED